MLNAETLDSRQAINEVTQGQNADRKSKAHRTKSNPVRLLMCSGCRSVRYCSVRRHTGRLTNHSVAFEKNYGALFQLRTRNSRLFLMFPLPNLLIGRRQTSF